jgi:drug/metabolite transporter superfamily protein YnfA
MNVSRNRWLLAAIASILGGYLLLAMAQEEHVSSILLVAGYCILLPLHLWVRHRSDDRVGE